MRDGVGGNGDKFIICCHGGEVVDHAVFDRPIGRCLYSGDKLLFGREMIDDVITRECFGNNCVKQVRNTHFTHEHTTVTGHQ